jgi:hypothetical protein
MAALYPTRPAASYTTPWDTILFGIDGEDARYLQFRDGDYLKIYGETRSGRLLKVVGEFVKGNRFRVFAAQYMDDREKRFFRKR